MPTTASCDACHRTTAWTPATFSHSNVAPGTCATCHNGSSATGKPGGHFVTTRSCDDCHRTTSWTPTLTYSHISIGYRAHRAGVDCNDCHRNNSEVISWQFPAYRPNCAGCHANEFETDKHKKVNSPRIYYTVSELQDCTGSCHIYTDSTFTQIQEARSNEHRPTDGGFD
ncbi:MAG: hypothetical protein BWZ07_03232 [Alphaproteobacteria bacterium ADurb.BinA280]|nr:MAG: hypothetical protein BWZ07_03232 [Alphaproteobacteria bacterium ADurb.BinA280]